MTETKKRPQLHEVLAVVKDLESASTKILDETIVSFTKKPHLFSGHVKSYEPFKEEDRDTLSYDDNDEVDTTVDRKLEYMFTYVTRYLDAVLQKEESNQSACADIVIGDDVIAENIPAPFLLGLEKRIKKLREVFDSIPTLEPGVVWEEDPEQGEGIFRSKEPLTQFKTKKEPKSKVLYEATKEHRAEIEKWHEDVNVGKFSTIRFSGAVSPAKKSELLKRVDTLAQAIKQARQRANCQDVEDSHVGDKLVDYILKG